MDGKTLKEFERNIRILKRSKLTQTPEFNGMLLAIERFHHDSRLDSLTRKAKNDFVHRFEDGQFFSILLGMLIEITRSPGLKQRDDLRKVYHWYQMNKDVLHCQPHFQSTTSSPRSSVSSETMNNNLSRRKGRTPAMLDVEDIATYNAVNGQPLRPETAPPGLRRPKVQNTLPGSRKSWRGQQMVIGESGLSVDYINGHLSPAKYLAALDRPASARAILQGEEQARDSTGMEDTNNNTGMKHDPEEKSPEDGSTFLEGVRRDMDITGGVDGFTEVDQKKRKMPGREESANDGISDEGNIPDYYMNISVTQRGLSNQPPPQTNLQKWQQYQQDHVSYHGNGMQSSNQERLFHLEGMMVEMPELSMGQVISEIAEESSPLGIQGPPHYVASQPLENFYKESEKFSPSVHPKKPASRKAPAGGSIDHSMRSHDALKLESVVDLAGLVSDRMVLDKEYQQELVEPRLRQRLPVMDISSPSRSHPDRGISDREYIVIPDGRSSTASTPRSHRSQENVEVSVNAGDAVIGYPIKSDYTVHFRRETRPFTAPIDIVKPGHTGPFQPDTTRYRSKSASPRISLRTAGSTSGGSRPSSTTSLSGAISRGSNKTKILVPGAASHASSTIHPLKISSMVSVTPLGGSSSNFREDFHRNATQLWDDQDIPDDLPPNLEFMSITRPAPINVSVPEDLDSFAKMKQVLIEVPAPLSSPDSSSDRKSMIPVTAASGTTSSEVRAPGPEALAERPDTIEGIMELGRAQPEMGGEDNGSDDGVSSRASSDRALSPQPGDLSDDDDSVNIFDGTPREGEMVIGTAGEDLDEDGSGLDEEVNDIMVDGEASGKEESEKDISDDSVNISDSTQREGEMIIGSARGELVKDRSEIDENVNVEGIEVNEEGGVVSGKEEIVEFISAELGGEGVGHGLSGNGVSLGTEELRGKMIQYTPREGEMDIGKVGEESDGDERELDGKVDRIVEVRGVSDEERMEEKISDELGEEGVSRGLSEDESFLGTQELGGEMIHEMEGAQICKTSMKREEGMNEVLEKGSDFLEENASSLPQEGEMINIIAIENKNGEETADKDEPKYKSEVAREDKPTVSAPEVNGDSVVLEQTGSLGHDGLEVSDSIAEVSGTTAGENEDDAAKHDEMNGPGRADSKATSISDSIDDADYYDYPYHLLDVGDRPYLRSPQVVIPKVRDRNGQLVDAQLNLDAALKPLTPRGEGPSARTVTIRGSRGSRKQFRTSNGLVYLLAEGEPRREEWDRGVAADVRKKPLWEREWTRPWGWRRYSRGMDAVTPHRLKLLESKQGITGNMETENTEAEEPTSHMTPRRRPQTPKRFVALEPKPLKPVTDEWKGRPLPDITANKDEFAERVASERRKAARQAVKISDLFSKEADRELDRMKKQLEWGRWAKRWEEADAAERNKLRDEMRREAALLNRPEVMDDSWERQYTAERKSLKKKKEKELKKDLKRKHKKSKKEKNYIDRIAASLDIWDIYREGKRGTSKGERKKAAIVLQKHLRGWLARRQFDQIKQKSRVHATSYSDFADYYSKFMTIVARWHGVKSPTIHIDLNEVEEFMDKKRYYETMFAKEAYPRKTLEYQQLEEFFKSCDLYPTQREMYNAVLAVTKKTPDDHHMSLTEDQISEIAFMIYVPTGSRLDKTKTRQSTWLNPLINGQEASKFIGSKEYQSATLSTSMRVVFDALRERREKEESERRQLENELEVSIEVPPLKEEERKKEELEAWIRNEVVREQYEEEKKNRPIRGGELVTHYQMGDIGVLEGPGTE